MTSIMIYSIMLLIAAVAGTVVSFQSFKIVFDPTEEIEEVPW